MDDSRASNLPVEVGQGEAPDLMSGLGQMFDLAGAAVYVSNVPPRSLAGAELVTRMMGTVTIEDDARFDKDLPVRYWLVHPVDQVGEDGEVTRIPRVVFAGDNGSVVAFASTQVMLQLARYILASGQIDWPVGTTIRVSRFRTRRNHTAFNLSVNVPQLAK